MGIQAILVIAAWHWVASLTSPNLGPINGITKGTSSLGFVTMNQESILAVFSVILGMDLVLSQ